MAFSSNYTGEGKSIGLKLYLEGIEVPINSLSLSERAGAAPQASIVLPLDHKISSLLPRTLVHVFYRDTFTAGRWLMIFEGEMSGFNVNRSGESRTITLDAVSYVNHWNFAVKDSFTVGGFKGQESTNVNVTYSRSNDDKSKVPGELQSFDALVDSIYSKLTDGSKEKDNLDAIIEANKSLEDYITLSLNVGASGIDGTTFNTVISAALKGEDNKIVNLIKGMTNVFAKSNIGYATFHIVYQIVKRMFGKDNLKLTSLVNTNQTDAMVASIKNQQANSPSTMTLIEMIMRTLDQFDYEMIMPSAPTYDVGTETPQSINILPSPELFAPLSCNTFFSDEVVQASYSRNMLTEPTRLGARLNPETILPQTEGLAQIAKLGEKLVISPSASFTYNPTEFGNSVGIQLSTEERLRGVYGIYQTDDFSELKSILDSSSVPEEDKDNFILEQRLRQTDVAYERKVLNARNFNLTTPYSPYRLCGLPGIYIDEVLPSISGKVVSISSTITANGSAMSQVAFEFPKTINQEIFDYGDRTLEDLLQLNGWSQGDANDKDKVAAGWPFQEGEKLSDGKSTASAKYNKDQEKFWMSKLWHDYQNPENSTFLSSWHDPDTYFPNNIGTKIYKSMVYGLEPDDDIEKFTDKADRDYFNGVSNQYNLEYDGSIGVFRSDNPGFDQINKDGVENTKWLGHFIQTLKAKYSSYSEFKKTFINKFIRRNIITDKQYWKFFINLKDGEKLADLDNLNKGIRDINKSIMEENKILTDMKKANTENPDASAPFVKQRRDAVKVLLKSLTSPYGENIVGN